MPFINYDIVLLIAEHVDQQTYFRLLRVCRGWNALLFTRAYRRISVGDKQIYRLFHSVHSNSSIGAAIRDLDVSWAVKGLEFDDGASKAEYDVQVVKDAARRVSDDPIQRGRWSALLQKGYSDAWLAVLVLSLENLTNLCLDPSEQSNYFSSMLARAAMRRPPFDTKPALQRLESVTVKPEGVETRFDAAGFLPLFQLPAMRVFSAHGLYEVHDFDYGPIAGYPKPELGTSEIKELHLGSVHTRCNGYKGMADYITACANLEIFEYQHNDETIPDQTSLSFESGAFYTALITQKHSLRELRLNDHGENTMQFENQDEEEKTNVHFNRFGSLAEFCQLREMRIPVRSLLEFGFDDLPSVSLPEILPPSLEYLHLCDYREEDFVVVMEDLKRLLEQRAERFPNLKKLRIQTDFLAPVCQDPWKFDVRVSMKRDFEPLAELCREVEIDFALCKAEWRD